ncbi:hypothetical protein BDQ12DRAFT_386549 [Crucibulum laeve]|uniref:Uncharacterized protein n=1 Tax=Crucibulum laeve TaxID=68775 RepID=A0A5C3M9D6_9AGAR|nr:hypothetical protein BDQ12DRAFT_386549 [Crucibulum laeve]
MVDILTRERVKERNSVTHPPRVTSSGFTIFTYPSLTSATPSLGIQVAAAFETTACSWPELPKLFPAVFGSCHLSCVRQHRAGWHVATTRLLPLETHLSFAVFGDWPNDRRVLLIHRFHPSLRYVVVQLEDIHLVCRFDGCKEGEKIVDGGVFGICGCGLFDQRGEMIRRGGRERGRKGGRVSRRRQSRRRRRSTNVRRPSLRISLPTFHPQASPTFPPLLSFPASFMYSSPSNFFPFSSCCTFHCLLFSSRVMSGSTNPSLSLRPY